MPEILVLWLVALIPGLLWVWYIYRQDLYEPEPFFEIFKVFLAGMLLVIPAGLIESIWRGSLTAAMHRHDWGGLLVNALLVVALTEEGLKSLVLGAIIKNNPELDEPADGIIYGATLGLGFASLENLLWISAFGFGTALSRGVITTMAHAAFTGWIGYYLARYKLGAVKNPRLLVLGFSIAWLGHGLYDFFLFTREALGFLLAVVVLGSLVLPLYRLLKRQVANSPFRGGRDQSDPT